jgi:hypothetical protein
VVLVTGVGIGYPPYSTEGGSTGLTGLGRPLLAGRTPQLKHTSCQPVLGTSEKILGLP